MLERDRIEYYFSLTHELPEIEFKGTGRRGDNPLFGRVVRGAIALANRHGGGTLIIGVPETGGILSFDGLTPEQLATWKYDEIAKGFNSHTSTSIVFDRWEYEHKGKIFLVLSIHEFTSVPVMCMKDYLDRTNPKDPTKFVLQAERFYIRTINHPQSVVMKTSEEIRILSELIANKGIENFVRRVKSAGLDIAPRPQDKELFAQELQDWNGALLDEIRSRGYWDIRIRPVTYQRDRVPLPELRQLLLQAAVNYRGWEFPYVTPQHPKRGLTWIGLENQKEHGLQAWRFFQSGQLAATTGILDDWGDRLSYPYQGIPQPGEVLSALDVIYRLTEIYDVASHLARTDVYRDEASVVIDLILHKTQGRRLIDRGTNSIIFSQASEAENIPYTAIVPKEDIIANPHGLALKPARFVFERFDWNPSDQLLDTIQSQIIPT